MVTLHDLTTGGIEQLQLSEHEGNPFRCDSESVGVTSWGSEVLFSPATSSEHLLSLRPCARPGDSTLSKTELLLLVSSALQGELEGDQEILAKLAECYGGSTKDRQ